MKKQERCDSVCSNQRGGHLRCRHPMGHDGSHHSKEWEWDGTDIIKGVNDGTEASK